MFKRYIKAKGPRVNNIKCELFYSLGGINLPTFKQKARGYYLWVTPIKRSKSIEDCSAFAPAKKCILEVTRQSKGAEEKAKALIDKYLKSMVKRICAKNQIILEEEI